MSTNVPISSFTLSQSAASVTISQIPQTYTDLFVVITGNSAGNYINTLFRFNQDVTASYYDTRMGVTFPGNNATTSSNHNNNVTYLRLVAMDNADKQFAQIDIANYSNNYAYKTVLLKTLGSDGSGYGDFPLLGCGVWANTSPITSISFGTDGTNFASGTTFNLYGINAANSAQAKATGGDSIYRDSSYWYHVFNKSGTFTPSQNLSNVDYLVVAGGGGGGGSYGGGGGAGGLRSTVTATGGGGSLESALSLTASTAYTVTIGAGGIGATGDNATTGVGQGSDGSNSVFSTITATGGGGGGQEQVGGGNGRTGGSGGGGGGQGGGSNTGGARTASPVQGFNGGNGFGQGGVGPGGGGGGAGAVGANGATSTAGSGGAGATVAITGSSITYAGGGGGGIITGTAGSGGSGGGGAGSSTGNGTSGTANTGGGGGGADNNFTGGSGGSGIVIVRYPV